MKEKASAAKGKTDTEELLNFDLDEESPLDLDSLDGDEEVIDLVDLVEKEEEMGLTEERPEAARKEGEIELGGLDLELESLGSAKKKPSAIEKSQGEEELDLSDLTLELGGEEEVQQKLSEIPQEGDVIEGDLGNLLAEEDEIVLVEAKKTEEAVVGGDAEITEADLDGILEEEFGKEVTEVSLQTAEIGSSEEELRELEGALKLEESAEFAQAIELKETEPDVEKVPDSAEKEEILGSPSSTASEPVVQEIAGLSEEKLEMMISRVVENVVERVAREAMTNVAEKLITEAIDALKRSMELSDPQ